MEKLLTVNETAELLQLSRQQVYNLTARGELPSIKIGKSVRVRQDQLDRWIESRSYRQR